MDQAKTTRRRLLRGLFGLGAGALVTGPARVGARAREALPAPGPSAHPPRAASARASLPADALRTIPSSGVAVPRIGLGTWITFDLAPGAPGTDRRVAVLRAFLERGGGVVDSSPMYGRAEAMLGHALARLPGHDGTLFAASKIWTPVDALGPAQMRNTESLWGVSPMDLMHVHNLVNARAHLARLRDWKAEGRIRHVGLSTSHGRRHDELERLMRTEDVDVVQLTLNLRRREAEARLLPLAADRGIAVLVNRPLQRGALPDELARRPLSPLACELGCRTWAQFCLLYASSHPAVTAAIPATADPEHLAENMAVLGLDVPDAATRAAMAREIG